jgi:uncharacterized membrane protein
MTTSNAFLVGATLCLGLMSGLFYAYACSVMPALKRLDDFQFISAMQSINRAIQNPIFFISFFGVLIFLPIATYLNYTKPVSIIFWYLVVASIIYFTGSFLVTVIGNIPLNNSLDEFELTTASKDSLRTTRQLFETKWTRLNNIRTASSILAFIFALLACIKSYAGNTTAP